MSYILDALRKSDQQRRRGTAPTLLQPQTVAVAPKRPALLPYGLLAFVLLGAGIAIGWLRPWQPGPAAPAPAGIGVQQSEPGRSQTPAVRPELAPKLEPEPQAQNSAPEVRAQNPAPEVQARNPASAAKLVAVPAPESAPAPAAAPALTRPRAAAGDKSETQSAPPAALAPTPEKAAAPAREQPPGTAAADAAPAQNVVSLAELPPALQQELPPMTISVHAYSATPAARLVGINNQMLHEGDYVVPGLKLEQITPEGMVFGYKGYSFRRGVK